MKKYFHYRLNKTSKRIIKYVLDLLIVAFGVFLGIYIGDKNNQQKTDANVINALTQILSEFDLNSEKLVTSYIYHEKVSFEIDSAIKSLDEADFEVLYYKNNKFQFLELPSWKGVGTASLSNSVYESAKIGGVFQELNISTINLISSVYDYQNIYSDFTKTTIDKFLHFDSNTKTGDVVQTLRMLTKYDIAQIEKNLQKEINIATKELKMIIKNKKFKK